MKFRAVVREHKWALVCGIFLSLLVVMPQIVLRSEHRTPNDPDEIIELIPDSPWSPRVREIQDGYSFGNIYNKEGKDNPNLFQPLGTQVVAYMGSIFSLNINDTLLLSRIVLPFAVFLLIYCFVFLLSRDKLVSAAIGLVFLLGDPFMSYSGLSLLLQGVSPESFLRIARPVNPAMVYIFLFSFLAFFWLFFREKKWWQGVAATVLLGLNFYNYFYTWTYLYAFGAFLGLFLLFQKRWRDALNVALVYIGAAILAIPYFINLIKASSYPAYELVGQRLGIIFTHHPLMVGSTVIFALVIFFFLFPKEDKDNRLFGFALLIAPFLTMNQQILTGRIMQADHYHWFFHKPIGLIFVMIAVFYTLQRFGFINFRKIVLATIIAGSFATGVFVQAYSYKYDTDDGGQIAIERQKYAPVMEWLNENGKKDAMVFGNDESSHLTVIYTPLNVLYHRAVCCTTLSATEDQLLDTMFLFYRIRGVGEAATDQVFADERDIISANMYGIYYRKLYGQYASIPDEKISYLAGLYKDTLRVPSSTWIEGMLAKYEVEYVVWDKKTDPAWNLNYPFLKPAAQFGDIVVYQYSSE